MRLASLAWTRFFSYYWTLHNTINWKRVQKYFSISGSLARNLSVYILALGNGFQQLLLTFLEPHRSRFDLCCRYCAICHCYHENESVLTCIFTRWPYRSWSSTIASIESPLKHHIFRVESSLIPSYSFRRKEVSFTFLNLLKARINYHLASPSS